MDGKIQLGLDQSLYGEKQLDPFIIDEDKLSIQDLIPKILFERQSFLNITEESLQKEIEELENNPSKDNEVVETVEPQFEESEKSDYEFFVKQKHDLSRNIASALNETSLSLDFVSLLISGSRPNLGKATISPHLSKSVPLGSLGADKLEDVGPQNDDDKLLIGQGWKHEALKKITESFKAASNNLREQVSRENNYWDGVCKVLNNKEVMCKMKDPTSGHKSIGVKYGYGDSGSSYNDKGLAILKRDSNGNVSFLPVVNELSSRGGSSIKATDKVYKYIRVKILSKIDDDFMLTGQSIFNAASINGSSQESGKIISEIEKARYFLFEEDLFYQLTREAKTLINYNVSIISDKIIIEIHNHIIEIESVVYDENNEDELNNIYQNINIESSMNNTKAQHILIFLKLMLCCFYKYNLELKRSVPTARTKWKLANSHPLILRPLLGHIRHEINLNNMYYILQQILSEYDNSMYDIEVKKYSQLNSINDTKKIQDVFEKSTKSPVSQINVKLFHPKNNKILKIIIDLSATETFCNLIAELNVFRFNDEKDFKANENGIKLVDIKVSEIYDIEECLQWMLSKFIKDI